MQIALEGTESQCFSQHSSALVLYPKPPAPLLAGQTHPDWAGAGQSAGYNSLSALGDCKVSRARSKPGRLRTKRAEGVSHEAIGWGR
jgi:hypothetical protein